MIDYNHGTWGIRFIFQLRGSVIGKTIIWALPCSLFAAGVTILTRNAEEALLKDLKGDLSETMNVWAAYTGVLGFLLVFRTNIAYQRFWEGGTTLQQVRGVWFNATSNLIAFCSASPDMKDKVEHFQHLLVRLMSMLYCAALQRVAEMEDEHFEILGCQGISRKSIAKLSEAEDSTEVLMQWIQKLIVNHMKEGTLTIAPPIASRVFQELSNGIVDVQNAKKVHEFPFPFPYAQLLTVCLIAHWIMTPAIVGMICQQPLVSATYTFLAVNALWGINYIAAELEMPFGDDANDLPIAKMQEKFNKSLVMLLDPLVQTPPKFDFDPKIHRAISPQRSRQTVSNWITGNEIFHDCDVYTAEETCTNSDNCAKAPLQVIPEPAPELKEEPKMPSSTDVCRLDEPTPTFKPSPSAEPGDANRTDSRGHHTNGEDTIFSSVQVNPGAEKNFVDINHLEHRLMDEGAGFGPDTRRQQAGCLHANIPVGCSARYGYRTDVAL